jgi:ABC-type transport system substrate-binding protein
MAEAVVTDLAQVGIAVTVQTLAEDALESALRNREFDLALVDVRPPADPDLYDFWSQDAIVRGQNYAGWNDRRASEALENGRRMWLPEEREQQYGTFLQRYDQALPALTLFQYVTSYGLSDVVQSAEIGPIHAPRDRYNSLPQWTIQTREIAVDCPPDA